MPESSTVEDIVVELHRDPYKVTSEDDRRLVITVQKRCHVRQVSVVRTSRTPVLVVKLDVTGMTAHKAHKIREELLVGILRDVKHRAAHPGPYVRSSELATAAG